jgi:hypothetical protein
MKSKMKLIILSGAGDPDSHKYKPVYENIIQEAKRRGFDDVVMQGWCGQHSYKQEGTLSFNAAVIKTKQLIKQYENQQEPYGVICRSFGCATFLKAATDLKPQYITFATLWGPPPMFTLFELFKGNIEKTKQDGFHKGVNIDNSLYGELYPLELLIREFNLNFNLRIAYGTKDPYCTEAFTKFLETSFPNPKISYKGVADAIHEVEDVNQEYFNALFNF